MEIKIVHFYPDLMNLYGSYANVSVLKRYLEGMGNTVTVDYVGLEENHAIDNADFVFMGAGTERRQKFALMDFIRYEKDIRTAADEGVPMLFAGNSMELLGKTITEANGKVYAGIGLTNFNSLQLKKRIVGDVYGNTDLYSQAVIGFMNKCSVITGIQNPLLTSVRMGFGNENENTPEGFHWKNVFGSELTGPILVKNPRLLDTMAELIYQHRGEPLPVDRPSDGWAEAAYSITAEQLLLRIQSENE